MRPTEYINSLAECQEKWNKKEVGMKIVTSEEKSETVQFIDNADGQEKGI
jgi:hypothetical protein